jgi:uracil phosphoribosyltransferase
MLSNLYVLDHPLAKHCITHLRDRKTKPALFRTLTHKLTTLLAIEATRQLRMNKCQIETPMETIREAEVLDDSLVVIPILRAGLGMLHAVTDLFPDVAVGYIGLERDETTAEVHSYYCKLPNLKGKVVLVVDPMLATGGSVCQALAEIEKHSPARVILLSIVAAPEGAARINENFPHVEIFTAALDRELNTKKYILPGLGDAGDRLYGTTG